MYEWGDFCWKFRAMHRAWFSRAEIYTIGLYRGSVERRGVKGAGKGGEGQERLSGGGWY